MNLNYLKVRNYDSSKVRKSIKSIFDDFKWQKISAGYRVLTDDGPIDFFSPIFHKNKKTQKTQSNRLFPIFHKIKQNKFILQSKKTNKK